MMDCCQREAITETQQNDLSNPTAPRNAALPIKIQQIHGYSPYFW